MEDPAPETPPSLSYGQALADRRVFGLILGDLLATVGTGMLIVAMPVQTLAIHGRVAKPIAIGLVETAPYALAAVLALAIGVGRLRILPRTVLIADSVSRSVVLGVLGLLAVTHRLSLVVLIIGLLLGSVFRIAGSSSRRLLATAIAGDRGRYAVNGLLGLNVTIALYILGPVIGGVIVAVTSPGVALFCDAAGALLLLAAVLATTRRAVVAEPRSRAGRESGLRILRRRPVAARLLVVEFFFNFFYMPVEIALPLLVRGRLHADASALGAMWGALGVGAFLGAALVDRLRRLPQRHLLIAIIGLWAACPIALALVTTLPAAMIVFALGGLVYAPFTPVAYSFLQSGLRDDEQQQVVTLWTTGSTVAAPLGLLVGGPLILFAGTSGGLVLSGVLTALLVPIAAYAVLRRREPAVVDPADHQVIRNREAGTPGRP
ncbi:MFS transporter [Microlunatus sp. Gsoil 973]|uniref:MFS transporter n=1 Tax=Microlunatus sp. Gsoil 973 TaxID=2672569 RepID=UPI0012B4618F|nr:MFS transporter [Microlunatus sp. Gsoil 973]QGN32495.1 MFS transporter [Microlunatus sp. Gsoil 973]